MPRIAFLLIFMFFSITAAAFAESYEGYWDPVEPGADQIGLSGLYLFKEGKFFYQPSQCSEPTSKPIDKQPIAFGGIWSVSGTGEVFLNFQVAFVLKAAMCVCEKGEFDDILGTRCDWKAASTEVANIPDGASIRARYAGMFEDIAPTLRIDKMGDFYRRESALDLATHGFPDWLPREFLSYFWPQLDP